MGRRRSPSQDRRKSQRRFSVREIDPLSYYTTEAVRAAMDPTRRSGKVRTLADMSRAEIAKLAKQHGPIRRIK